MKSVKSPQSRIGRLFFATLCAVLSACQMSTSKPAHSAAPQEIPAAAQTLFASAVAAQRDQQWPQAEQQLTQLTEKYPQLSGPHLNLALIYTQTQRPELAEAEFKRALLVNPNNIDAYDQ